MSDLRAISLFTGAGGLDFGIEAAGFETRVAVEMDADCCRTLQCARPGWSVIESKIESVPTADILSAGRMKKSQPDLLVGGPPCQPFSKSGYWSKGDTLRLDDPRASTLDDYMRVVQDALPQVILLENVAGMTYSGKDDGIKYLVSRLEQINKKAGTKYHPCCRILRMVEYGVPQLRERFFLVADRDGREFEFPAPTYRHPNSEEDTSLYESLPPAMTAWDAIGGLPGPSPDEILDVRGKWGNLLPSIPEGQNYLWHTDRKDGLPLFGWRTRYWGFLLKLAKRAPAWTIQAQPGSAIGPFHWSNRRLSTQELLRLMTFPEVALAGGRTSIQRQLGNAVPSLMTEVLGRCIRKQFLDGDIQGELTLLPVRAAHIPGPETVSDVPEEYLHLVGDYEPHPGTGKGPVARQRLAEG